MLVIKTYIDTLNVVISMLLEKSTHIHGTKIHGLDWTNTLNNFNPIQYPDKQLFSFDETLALLDEIETITTKVKSLYTMIGYELPVLQSRHAFSQLLNSTTPNTKLTRLVLKSTKTEQPIFESILRVELAYKAMAAQILQKPVDNSLEQTEAELIYKFNKSKKTLLGLEYVATFLTPSMSKLVDILKDTALHTVKEEVDDNTLHPTQQILEIFNSADVAENAGVDEDLISYLAMPNATFDTSYDLIKMCKKMSFNNNSGISPEVIDNLTTITSIPVPHKIIEVNPEDTQVSGQFPADDYAYVAFTPDKPPYRVKFGELNRHISAANALSNIMEKVTIIEDEFVYPPVTITGNLLVIELCKAFEQMLNATNILVIVNNAMRKLLLAHYKQHVEHLVTDKEEFYTSHCIKAYTEAIKLTRIIDRIPEDKKSDLHMFRSTLMETFKEWKLDCPW